jgi:hypothetical protein
MPARKWPLAYLILVALLALAVGFWNHYGTAERCETDGQALSPALRVDLKMPGGVWHAFCTIECARRWLARQPRAGPEEAVVRDALSGEPLDAYVAFFVRSKVVTSRSSGNNIHAFRFRTDAMEHLRLFGGEEINDPFQVE